MIPAFLLSLALGGPAMLSSRPERSGVEGPAVAVEQNQTATPQASAPTPDTTNKPQLGTPLDRAEDAIEQLDLPRAHTAVEDYLAHNKPDARALYDLGSIELQQNHAPQAEANLRRALELDPKLPQIHIVLGRAIAAEDRPDEARKEWQTVTADASVDTRYRAEAFRAIAQMDVNLVAAHATQQEPADEQSPSPLAAEARDCLLEALKLSPETVSDKLLASRIAIASGDPADAEDALRKAIAADPANVDLQLELAGVLRTERKFPEAEAALRPAHTAQPDDLAVTVMLAGILASESKNTEALDLLNAAHTAHPDNAEVTRMLADVANMRGSAPALASTLLEQMLAKNPDDPALLADYGAALIRQNRFAEAVPVLKRAVVAKPDNGEAWGSLAFAASRTGDLQVVLTALTQRKKYLSDNASTYFLWGQAYDKLHRTKEAADCYRQFLAAAGGKFPDQEFQVRHRLMAMGQNK